METLSELTGTLMIQYRQTNTATSVSLRFSARMASCVCGLVSAYFVSIIMLSPFMVDVQWEVQSGMYNLQMTHMVNRVEAQPINITDESFKQTEHILTTDFSLVKQWAST